MLSIIKPNDKYHCDYGQGSRLLEPEHEYIINSNWAKELGLNSTPIVVDNYKLDIDLSNKRLLFIRAIGGGDLLFLSPMIQVIKDKYPSCKIGFTCIKEQHGILELIPGIDEIIQYPITRTEFDNFDHYFQVAQTIEGNRENQHRNVYEVYAETLGLLNPGPEQFRPTIKDCFSSSTKDDTLIGIHPFANDPIRKLNPSIIKGLCNSLHKSGYTPIIIGTEAEKKNHLLLNMFDWSCDRYRDYVDLCKLIYKCKSVIVTDSMIMHLAQAIGTPTVSIHGPFSAECRVKYYQNISVIDSNPECRCFMHQYGKCRRGFPEPICLRFNIDTVVNLAIGSVDNVLTPTIYAPEIEQYGM